MTYKVAIIGAGAIGSKRAKAVANNSRSKLVLVSDIDNERAKLLAQKYDCKAVTHWKNEVTRDRIDVAIVATPNKYLLPICTYALEQSIHVLCEKPLGRNAREARELVDKAQQSKAVLKTGFNHRHHPAIWKAKQLADAKAIGTIMCMRCRYGHGGRFGYEKEWRAKKDVCGGGELLDQGVHVVDLFRWFTGEFSDAFGYTQTYFWNMDVEDNAFALFRTKDGIVASMHTSWTQWKNLFSFEIFGKNGVLAIEGLGGSYGLETLVWAKRKPEFGVPLVQKFEFPGEDMSWQEEWAEFVSAIENRREPLGNSWDGYRANRMIDAVYESSATGKIVPIKE